MNPKGAEQEVKYEYCTPGYLDFARYKSVAGRPGNRPFYVDFAIWSPLKTEERREGYKSTRQVD